MLQRRRFVVAGASGCVSSPTGFGSTTDEILVLTYKNNNKYYHQVISFYLL